MNNTVFSDICDVQQAAIRDDGSSTTRKNLQALLPLVYGIPSLILGIEIVILLIRRRTSTFNSSFYTLFYVSTTVDMLEWMFFTYIRRLSSAPLVDFLFSWIPKEGPLLSIIYFFVCYVGFLDHIPSLLLSSNRFTSVLYPLHHKAIWRKIIFPLLIIYFLYPIFLSWHFLFLNQIKHCTLWSLNKSETYHYFVFQPPIQWIPLQIEVTVVAFFSCTLGLIINIFTIKSLILNRKKIQASDKDAKIEHKVEFKLFIISLMMFLCELFLGITMMVLYIATKINPTSQIQYIVLEIQPFILDVMCLSPPWMLIIMSSSIRNQTFIQRFKKFQLNNNTQIHTIHNAQLQNYVNL